jgi:hypothetical protein
MSVSHRLHRDTWILGTLTEAAANLLSNVDLFHVKKCKNSACILYLYDTTMNHARNWCDWGLRQSHESRSPLPTDAIKKEVKFD